MLSVSLPAAPAAVVAVTAGAAEADATDITPVVTGMLLTPEHSLADAAKAGNLEALHAALAQGADPSAEVPKGEKRFSTDEHPTALQFAIEGGQPGMVQALLDAHARCEAPRLSRQDWLSGSDRAIVRESGRLCRPPVHYAVQNGLVEDAQIIWKALVDAGASDEHLRIILGSGPNKWIVNNEWQSRGMASWLLEQALTRGQHTHTLEAKRAMVAFLFDAREACRFTDCRFLGLGGRVGTGPRPSCVTALHIIASTHGGERTCPSTATISRALPLKGRRACATACVCA